MRILNLFAGIGGNRLWWNQVPNLEITSIEKDYNVYQLYRKRFPNDNTLWADAWDYAEFCSKGYDFIWASPPCYTHSRMNKIHGKRYEIDFRLYWLIDFLTKNYKGSWIVENTFPYYSKSDLPQEYQKYYAATFEIGRHKFWSNKVFVKFPIPKLGDWINIPTRELAIKTYTPWYLLKILPSKSKRNHDFKRNVMRNTILPEIGLELLKQIIKEKQKRLI